MTLAPGTTLGPYEPLPRGRALFDYWTSNAGGPCERRLLETLASATKLSRGALARISGYRPTSGTFATGLARLRKLRLIEGKNMIHLTKTLAEALATPNPVGGSS